MRIIIPSIQVPFIKGGSILMTDGLKKALDKFGYETEIVTIPFKFFPASSISETIDFCSQQDFNDFNGYKVDCIIALQFPAYYVRHDKKIIWLMHQHRAAYDLLGTSSDSIEEDVRDKIVKYDNREFVQHRKMYCMSKNIARRLKKFNNIEAKPLYHPPYGEDKFFCEDSYGYIFYPSRLEKLKRQDLLLKSLKHTKTKVKVLISGTGSQHYGYQRLIKKLGVGDKVKLLGYISEKEKYVLYSRSLAVFFGPYDEDYGYVTLEAMLSQKPVITCGDSGGPLEFVIDSENGCIIKPDPKTIAEKIDWLYLNKGKAKKMGKAGRELYLSKKISWDNVVTKLTNLGGI